MDFASELDDASGVETFAAPGAKRFAFSLSLYRTNAFAPTHTRASTAAHMSNAFARLRDETGARRRLEPGDHSVPHIEPWSHLLYFLSGTGDVTINGETQPVATGTVCQISAGQKHSLRNLGEDDMIVLTIYDPPRKRVD